VPLFGEVFGEGLGLRDGVFDRGDVETGQRGDGNGIASRFFVQRGHVQIDSVSSQFGPADTSTLMGTDNGNACSISVRRIAASSAIRSAGHSKTNSSWIWSKRRAGCFSCSSRR